MERNNRQFKLVTYNIHRGLSAFRKVSIRDKLALILKKLDADIVCLQEVWTNNPMLEPNLEDLTQSIWTYHAYGKNVVYDNGHQGNVIASRFPISRWKNLDLSVPSQEPRGCLFAEIEISKNNRIAVLSQHLGLSEKERAYQINKLNEYLYQEIDSRSPVILAGDFNDWRRKVSKSLKNNLGLIEAHRQYTGRYARTYPSICPVLHLDRIYYRNCHVLSAQAYSDLRWNGLSDHIPLGAEFTLDIPITS